MEHQAEGVARYCTGRTCSLTGLCIQVQEELREYFDASLIVPHPCMHQCKKGGAFMLRGSTFTSLDLPKLEEIVNRFKKKVRI